MILPDMRYADGISKRKQLQFGGLNHTVGAEDGELWDMKNLSGDDYPVLSVRPRRQMYRKLERPNGMFAWNGLLWVDGTDVYFDGVPVGQVNDCKKTFGAVGPYIVLLPDKVCYHTLDGTLKNLESSWSQTDESVFKSGIGDFSNSGDDSVCVRAEVTNAYTNLDPDRIVSVVDFSTRFREGDAVTIYGVKDAEGNALEDGFTAIIRSFTYKSGKSGADLYYAFSKIVFYEGALAGIVFDETAKIVIKRAVPDLLCLCEDGNRLWGCDDDTIYASKLGDPFNWNVFDGLETDSWAVTPGSSGEFTGCINFQGYPTFFKEDRIYKVYGSTVSNFEVVDSPYLGVAKGCAGTLAEMGSTLFYLASSGMMSYTGSIPQPIGQAFGCMRFVDGQAGSDGLKYYASLKDADEMWRLYVFDAQKRLWHIEDELQAVSLCRLDGDMYCLDSRGQISLLGAAKAAPEGCEEEADLPWMAEFGDFTEENPNHKGLSKLQLRLQMENGSQVRVLVQYDSDGVWRLVRAVTGDGSKRNYYLPVIPRRCDHYRLRLEGSGRSRLYSLVRETYAGSERNTKYWG